MSQLVIDPRSFCCIAHFVDSLSSASSHFVHDLSKITGCCCTHTGMSYLWLHSTSVSGLLRTLQNSSLEPFLTMDYSQQQQKRSFYDSLTILPCFDGSYLSCISHRCSSPKNLQQPYNQTFLTKHHIHSLRWHFHLYILVM